MNNAQKIRDNLEKQMDNFVKAFTMFELVCYRHRLENTNEIIALFAIYVDAYKGEKVATEEGVPLRR